MRNVKVENHWDTDGHWTKMGHVHVPGNKQAAPFPAGLSQQEGEKVVQSWQKVAVLRTYPTDGIMIGYITDGNTHMSYLNEIIDTHSGLFGMRVGDSDVTFFVHHRNPKTDTTLELVEIADENDPRYADLPVY